MKEDAYVISTETHGLVSFVYKGMGDCHVRIGDKSPFSIYVPSSVFMTSVGGSYTSWYQYCERWWTKYLEKEANTKLEQTADFPPDNPVSPTPTQLIVDESSPAGLGLVLQRGGLTNPSYLQADGSWGALETAVGFDVSCRVVLRALSKKSIL